MSEEGYQCMNGSTRNNQVSLGSSPSGSPVATYSNDQSTDYLTPAPDSRPPELPAFPARFNRSQSVPQSAILNTSFNTSFNTSTAQLLPRADSGIESDCYPRSPTSSTATAPRASTLYEYIDLPDVRLTTRQETASASNGRVPQRLQQQQLNTAQQLNTSNTSGTSTVSVRGSELSSTYHGDAVRDTDDASLTDPSRRRVNPMYDALERSATRLYAQTTHCKQHSDVHRRLCALWCAFVVVFVLFIVLLAILIYILAFLVPGLKSDLQNQEDRIKQMESSLAGLNLETGALQNNLPSNISTSNPSSVLSALQSVGHLNVTVWSLKSDLQTLNARLQQQISNISLTPGPQGVQGAGNLSLCYYKNSTSNTYLPSPASFTTWQPSEDVLENNMVMSAACGVANGSEQSVESNVISSNKVQYRCRCNGGEKSVVDSTSSRQCIIHLLICPRTSPP